MAIERYKICPKCGHSGYHDMKYKKHEYSDGLPEGFTGFMWGCAVNGAREIVGAPGVPNPAIITL